MREKVFFKKKKTSQKVWQGKKDSNLRMSESKSDALTNLATPLQELDFANPKKLCKPTCVDLELPRVYNA